MPVPMTTGQLRSKVADMEIGDYIKCVYEGFSSSNPGAFKALGLAEGIGMEINIKGYSSASSGYNHFFYFVKVNKGLLIADRVLQYNVTWDMLNTWKRIQGHSFDNGNIIPTMTSNTSPSGVASASSDTSTYESWKAFDKTATRWQSNLNQNEWLAYQFPQPVCIKSYSITALNNNASPNTWRFEASNNNLDWVVLDSRKSVSIPSGRNIYSFINNDSFINYRIFIELNNGNSSTIQIQELEMFETVGTIRSLTGGVAYADANGNKSTTDQSKGGWPQSNEWDRYIVNFPQDKIQAGKTLDDVFHWNGVGTFTQDTPSGLSGATSSTRAARGGSGTGVTIQKMNIVSSSISNNGWGFRPAFAYREE